MIAGSSNLGKIRKGGDGTHPLLSTQPAAPRL